MNYRVLGSVLIAAAIAFARPVAYVAQEAGRAAEILAAARKAIGGGKLDSLKTFSMESSVERNLSNMQIASDVEIVLDLPDKYLRVETPRGAGGGMVRMSGLGPSGFNGDRPVQKIQPGMMSAGGGMMIRMGGSGAVSGDSGEKPTPEQIEQLTKQMVRSSRIEASRLMLGWFATAHPSANAEYVYAGEAESADGKAFVIDVKNADNLTARLLIDQQSHLPLLVTYKGPQPRVVSAGPSGVSGAGGGAHVITSAMSDEDRKKAQADIDRQMKQMQSQPQPMVDYTIYFEEWRSVDGIKFPHKLRRAMAGTTTEEWTVGKVKVNPKVDPKRFAGES